MHNVSLKDAKAGFSSLVDLAAAGEFVTVTRHGKPAAVIVSVEAAELAKRAIKKDRPSLVRYLANFPVGIDLQEDVFGRNSAPGREVDL